MRETLILLRLAIAFLAVSVIFTTIVTLFVIYPITALAVPAGGLLYLIYRKGKDWLAIRRKLRQTIGRKR